MGVAHWKGQQNCTQCKWWYRIQTPNGVISHPSGVGPGTVFKEGLMKHWIVEMNALLNVINHRTETDNISLYAKDLYELKYQFLIKKCKDVGPNHVKDPMSFIEYSNNIKDLCSSIDEHNPGKEWKVLREVDDMVGDIINNKKTPPGTHWAIY